MRGPSSSHSAASLRIGRLVRDLIGGESPRRFRVDYDPNGSLVTTHDGQGSDMGMFGGLMGWDADDARLPDYKTAEAEGGTEIEIRYVSYGAEHPNTYRMLLESSEGETLRATAISTGGGMMQLTELEGHPVSMHGDSFETVIFTSGASETKGAAKWLEGAGALVSSQFSDSRKTGLVRGQTRAALPKEVLSEAHKLPGVVRVCEAAPVLPVTSVGAVEVPFLTASGLEASARDNGWALWEAACDYEAQRGGLTREEVFDRMLSLVQIMRGSVAEGRAGTEYGDRILPCQSGGFARAMNEGMLIPGDVINAVILYVSAIMEVKSSMGVIVAAPTAGSCGACPGAVLAVSDQLGKTDEETAQAMLVAGMIGVLVAEHATFAAEMGGCMAECGSGSGMAAAAIVSMMGGSTEQALGAASLALQSSFGMTCDPIANRVEAPCLGKNVMAATNAVSCANMALAGYRHLIPLDEVLVAMNSVAGQMPHELRCTGKGGISATPTAREIERNLGGQPLEGRTGSPDRPGKVAC